MKTPAEIKKALECCMQMQGCKGCPYSGFKCVYELSKDALAYIQQLEKHTHELMVRCAESTEMAALFVQANMARSPKWREQNEGTQ